MLKKDLKILLTSKWEYLISSNYRVIFLDLVYVTCPLLSFLLEIV